MELGGVVLSPVIVRKEDYQLVDGYCRYATLKAMGMSKIYAYVGSF
jgi:ParB-like chromosome segregation protein Spo0J